MKFLTNCQAFKNKDEEGIENVPKISLKRENVQKEGKKKKN